MRRNQPLTCMPIAASTPSWPSSRKTRASRTCRPSDTRTNSPPSPPSTPPSPGILDRATGTVLNKPSSFFDGIPDKLLDGCGVEREDSQDRQIFPLSAEKHLHLSKQFGIFRTISPDLNILQTPQPVRHRAASQQTNSFPPECRTHAVHTASLGNPVGRFQMELR